MLVASVVALPAVAGASSSSSFVPTFLEHVACPSSKSCFAVGGAIRAIPGPTTKTLVEHWNGKRWSIMTTPNASVTTGGGTSLAGVACPSTSNCMAVGKSVAVNGSKLVQTTFTARWNGTSWKTVPSPNPKGGKYNELDAVACPGAKTCFAVGRSYAGTVSKPLAERWNGSSWSIFATPLPAGSEGELFGVGCAGAKLCFAVGHADPNPGPGSAVALIESWNGTKWSVATTLGPSGGLVPTLDAVTCRASTRCQAVGFYDGVGQKTLAAKWDGASWSVIATPNSPGATGSVLHDLSCTGAKTCFAVGWADFDNTAHQPERSLTEKWDGTGWSRVASPNPDPSAVTLAGVACMSPASCFAVGARGGSPPKVVIQHWNGTKWSSVTPPS